MSLSEIPKKFTQILKKNGAEDVASLLFVENVKTIRYANNQSTTIYNISRAELDTYVGLSKKIFVGGLEDLSDQALEDFAERIMTSIKYSKQSEEYAPLPSGTFKYRPKRRPDKRLLSLDNKEFVEFIERVINTSLEYGAKRNAGILNLKRFKIFLNTSTGIDVSDEIWRIELSNRAFADSDATGHWVSCASSLDNFNPEEVGRISAELAKMSMNARSIEPGKYDTLFGPMIFANLVSDYGSAASAFAVDAGFSFFVNKIGQKIASDIFTLIDDGTLESPVITRRFDDEGLPTRKNVIVENGILKTYLHNTKTGMKYKTGSTSSAGWISPHAWSFIVKPGDLKEEEAIKELRKGIYVTNSWYHRYQNYIQGDFSAILRDATFYVEDGEIKYPIKGLRLSDNMIRIFSNIQALGNKQHTILWWEVQTPTLVPVAIVKDVNYTKSVK
ncbi:MAG: TldD/PmbA family protein [Thermoprotei archaeon]